MTKIDPLDLRHVLGKFLTGVTVVTTLDQHGTPLGFTANSFTSVSLDPPLILVCLASSAGLAAVFGKTESFAINILSTEQESISNNFASKKEDRFADTEWASKSTGSPIIAGSAAWLDCEMYNKFEAGDHIILVGKIVEIQKADVAPLGYCEGRYCGVAAPEEAPDSKEQDEFFDSTPGLLFDEDDPFAF